MLFKLFAIMSLSALTSIYTHSKTTMSTKSTIGTIWLTFPSTKPTPSTDSWDEALGFNKIEVIDRRIPAERNKLNDTYYCKRDSKRIRRGFHYFDHENCQVWHCPKWPIPIGVWEFVYYNCTDIDVRLFPMYHKECRVHRCKTKRIDLKSEYLPPTVPPEYRTVLPYWTGTVFSESDESE